MASNRTEVQYITRSTTIEVHIAVYVETSDFPVLKKVFALDLSQKDQAYNLVQALSNVVIERTGDVEIGETVVNTATGETGVVSRFILGGAMVETSDGQRWVRSLTQRVPAQAC